MSYLIVRKTDGERTVIPFLTPASARTGLEEMRTTLAANGWSVVAEQPSRLLVARSGDVLATVQVRHGIPPEGTFVRPLWAERQSVRTYRPPRLLVAAAVVAVLMIGAVGGFGARQLEQAFAADRELEYRGVVEVMPPDGAVGTWRIGGRTVQVSDQTEIDQKDGLIELGSLVEVEGTIAPGGSVNASEIEVER